MDEFRAIGFTLGIDPEDHLHDLTPISPLLLGHQKPEIDCQMLFIIGAYVVGGWRPVME